MRTINLEINPYVTSFDRQAFSIYWHDTSDYILARVVLYRDSILS